MFTTLKQFNVYYTNKLNDLSDLYLFIYLFSICIYRCFERYFTFWDKLLCLTCVKRAFQCPSETGSLTAPTKVKFVCVFQGFIINNPDI